MQVIETNTEGLRRQFRVVVPAQELDTRLTERLNTLKDEVRIKGFRPGKVPMVHLKRLYGRSAMAEIVQAVMSEVARQTLTDRGERAATKPDFRLPEDTNEAEKILRGNADLAYTMAYEVLPKVDLGDFKAITVERPAVEVSDEEVDKQVSQLASNARSFVAKDGVAERGDRLTIAFVGKIDGVPFEGGTSENATVTIGDGRFIPGFAEQLVGLKGGDDKTIEVTFPDNYRPRHLAGKAATFDVTVKTVSVGDEVKIDDELAVRLGVESLVKLRDTVRQQVQGQYRQVARQRVKRQLLDRLDEMHAMELPPGMVEQEFDTIWRQITAELARSGRTFEDEGTTEVAAREDYRKIAERRVRLGLVMAEIGERSKIQVTDEEVQRALAAQMRQFPGQEQALVEYYRNNPDAVAGLRAPIFEDKVVDYLLELVQVDEKPVTPEELMRDEEDDRIL
jgi:trigger factor